MTTQYKVWLEIEEIDESRDHYQTVDTPGGSVATFDSYKEASEFVEFANELLDPDSEFSLGRHHRSGNAMPATGPRTLTLVLLQRQERSQARYG